MSAVHYFLKILLSIFLFLIVYMLIAGVWAYHVTDDIVEHFETRPLTDLAEYRSSQLAIIIAVEDPTFYDHIGIDAFTPGQGMTTITSSLARDFYLKTTTLDGFQGILQSFYQIIWNCCSKVDLGRDAMAIALQLKINKDKILQYFLSNVYLGRMHEKEVIGFDQAANTYFDKTIPELSLGETIQLVAMFKAPDDYSIHFHKKNNQNRSLRIHRLINGQCEPSEWFDTLYKSC